LLIGDNNAGDIVKTGARMKLTEAFGFRDQ
jgi:hypothetical protein